MVKLVAFDTLQKIKLINSISTKADFIFKKFFNEQPRGKPRGINMLSRC